MFSKQNLISIILFQPGTRVVLGGNINGLNTVGEGFLSAYSPPLLDEIETIEDYSFSSVDGINELRFTKSNLLSQKVFLELYLQ